MVPDERTRPRGIPPLCTLLMLAALSVAYTSWWVHFSVQHYRLICPPRFDDVVYMNDAAERLDAFHAGGWSGLIRSCWENAPHSPFSTLLAAAGFALFGLHEWAPYAANTVIVFVLLAFTHSLIRNGPLWLRVLCLAGVCALPLTRLAVLEFRPDIFVELLIAMGVVLLLSRPLTTSGSGYALRPGLVFGVVFLAKPTLCVFTLAMFLTALGSSLLCDQLVERPGPRRLLMRALVVVLAAAAIAAPYYLANWDHVSAYIYDAILGRDADVWQYPGSRSQQLLYYITGPGADAALAAYCYPVVAAVLVGFGWIVTRGSRQAKFRAVAFAWAALVAWGVPTAIKCRSPFYGMTFYGLLLFAGVLSLGRFCSEPWPSWRGWRYGVGFALAALAGLALWLPSPRFVLGTRGDSGAGSVAKTCSALLAAVHAQAPNGALHVFFTTECGPINPATLQWRARQEGYACRFAGPFVPQTGKSGERGIWRDLGLFRREMERAQFVIAVEPAQPRLEFPSQRYAGKILQMARSESELAELEAFRSFDGTVYHLFANRSLSRPKSSDSGPEERAPSVRAPNPYGT